MINIIKNKLLQAFAVAALVGSGSALAGQAAESEGGGLKGFNIGVSAKIDSLPRVTQKLVAPPFLPKHNQVAVGGPKLLRLS